MRIKAAVFDFDGTLFDSMGVWDTLGANYLRRKGKQPPADLTDRIKTMTLREAALLFSQEFGVDLPVEVIIRELDELAASAYREEILPKPGAEAFVRELGSRGIRCCIATATDRTLIEAALERCGMADCFSKIVTCGEVGCGKTKPDVFRRAMELLEADRDSTVVFEDALHAAETAKRDGFFTIGVYDVYESHPGDLRAVCDGWLPGFEDPGIFWKIAAEH